MPPLLRKNKVIRLWTAGVALGLLVSAAWASPVAWWRFEDNFQSAVGGASLELLPGNGDLFSDEVVAQEILDDGKKLKNRFSFVPGTSKSAKLNENEALQQCLDGGSFTIEAFIKLEGGENIEPESQYYRIIGNAVNEVEGGWSFGVHKNRLRFFAYHASKGGIVAQVYSDDELVAGRWYHVAVVGLKNGETLDVQLFMDGEIQSNPIRVHGGNDNAIQPIESGYGYLIGGYLRFRGFIDELRVSDEALSPDQFLKK